MKTLKMIGTTAILALALSISAYAGEISSPGLNGEITTPGVTQPAPQPGDIDTPGVVTEPGEIGTPGLTAILMALAAIF